MVLTVDFTERRAFHQTGNNVAQLVQRVQRSYTSLYCRTQGRSDRLSGSPPWVLHAHSGSSCSSGKLVENSNHPLVVIGREAGPHNTRRRFLNEFKRDFRRLRMSDGSPEQGRDEPPLRLRPRKRP